MTRLLASLALTCFLARPALAEQPWDAIVHRCAAAAEEQMHAQTNCAGCADSWKGAALCAVNTYYRAQIPETVTRSCIDRIAAARLQAMTCANCDRPIEETFRCVRGG